LPTSLSVGTDLITYGILAIFFATLLEAGVVPVLAGVALLRKFRRTNVQLGQQLGPARVTDCAVTGERKM